MTTYRIHSWPALAGGLAAAGGSVAFLWRDAIATGWTIEHGAMPVLVGLTILTAHLFGQAVREWRPVAAVAFGLLAIAGSGIIVSETMGRRAEVRDAKVAVAAKSADDLGRIGADYAKAQALVTEAQAWVAHECRTGTGPKCRGTTFTLNQRTAYAAQLKGQLEASAPAKPVDPKADRIAEVAGLFGASQMRARHLVQVFDPFSLALFFELASVVLFGFAVRHRPVPRRDPVPVSVPEPPPADREPRDDVIDWVREFRARQGRDPQIPEVQQQFRLPKTTAWRRIKAA